MIIPFFFYEDDRNKTSFFKKKKKSCLLPKPWMHILNTAAILASSVSIYLYCFINGANTADWEPLIENQKQGKGEEERFSLESRTQTSTEKAIPKISIFWNSKPVKDNRSYKMLCIITSKFASYQKNKLLKTSSDE